MRELDNEVMQYLMDT